MDDAVTRALVDSVAYGITPTSPVETVDDLPLPNTAFQPEDACNLANDLCDLFDGQLKTPDGPDGPRSGDVTYVISDDSIHLFDGTKWIKFSS